MRLFGKLSTLLSPKPARGRNAAPPPPAPGAVPLRPGQELQLGALFPVGAPVKTDQATEINPTMKSRMSMDVETMTEATWPATLDDPTSTNAADAVDVPAMAPMAAPMESPVSVVSAIGGCVDGFRTPGQLIGWALDHTNYATALAVRIMSDGREIATGVTSRHREIAWAPDNRAEFQIDAGNGIQPRDIVDGRIKVFAGDRELPFYEALSERLKMESEFETRGQAGGFRESFPEELAELGITPAQPHHFKVLDEPETRALFMKFESLGCTCEMGLVQRRFGAEPLGLLRWATVMPPDLIRLLEGGLAGYGAPETIEVTVAPWQEFIVHDRKYGVARHSFVRHNGLNSEEFVARECRRLEFLREKLISDIAAGEKILVYYGNRHLSDAEVMRIYEAVRSLGPAPLLIVQLAEPGHDAGSVEDRGDGLLIGYLDRWGVTRLPDTSTKWDISFDVWTQIAATAVAATCRADTVVVESAGAS